MTYIDGKLPPLEKNLQNEIASLEYITSSNNCIVTIKYNKVDVYPTYKTFEYMGQLVKLKNPIKVDNRSMK